MSESLLVAGVVCIVAAIVGGGVKLLGAEMPVLGSFPRQALLFAVGTGFLFASFRVNETKPAASPPAAQNQSGAPAQTAAQTPAPAPSPPPAAVNPSTSSAVAQTPSPPPPAFGGAAPCGQDALSCLPRSSAPVVFADPSAAGRAAADNIRGGLSTTQAQTQAIAEGASGRAARWCGILASNDSSPLGKHLAAVRLTSSQPADGQPSAACRRLAQSFL